MSETFEPISYQPCQVNATYEASGPVDYTGFIARLGGGDHLLHWENTIIWRFEDSKYDHIELALDSLKQMKQLKAELAHKPATVANNPLQAWAIFLDNGNNQDLVDDLETEGFPNYWRPRPDKATHECRVKIDSRLGQRMLEDWLG